MTFWRLAKSNLFSCSMANRSFALWLILSLSGRSFFRGQQPVQEKVIKLHGKDIFEAPHQVWLLWAQMILTWG